MGSVNEEWHPTVGATDASLSPLEAEYIADTLVNNSITQMGELAPPSGTEEQHEHDENM